MLREIEDHQKDTIGGNLYQKGPQRGVTNFVKEDTPFGEAGPNPLGGSPLVSSDRKKNDEWENTSDDNEDPDQKNLRIMEKFLVSDLARQSIIGGEILTCEYGDKGCSSEHPVKST